MNTTPATPPLKITQPVFVHISSSLVTLDAMSAMSSFNCRPPISKFVPPSLHFDGSPFHPIPSRIPLLRSLSNPSPLPQVHSHSQSASPFPLRLRWDQIRQNSPHTSWNGGSMRAPRDPCAPPCSGTSRSRFCI